MLVRICRYFLHLLPLRFIQTNQTCFPSLLLASLLYSLLSVINFANRKRLLTIQSSPFSEDTSYTSFLLDLLNSKATFTYKINLKYKNLLLNQSTPLITEKLTILPRAEIILINPDQYQENVGYSNLFRQ